MAPFCFQRNFLLARRIIQLAVPARFLSVVVIRCDEVAGVRYLIPENLQRAICRLIVVRDRAARIVGVVRQHVAVFRHLRLDDGEF